MPESTRFDVVFQKLQEAIAEDSAHDPHRVSLLALERITVEELDEISELRRLAQSFTDVQPTVYTTT